MAWQWRVKAVNWIKDEKHPGREPPGGKGIRLSDRRHPNRERNDDKELRLRRLQLEGQTDIV